MSSYSSRRCSTRPIVSRVLAAQAAGVAERGPPTRWKAVEEPRARQRLEEVEQPLALADAVEEDGGAAAERAAHVQTPGAEPEAVRGDALELRGDHPEVLGAPGHVDL